VNIEILRCKADTGVLCEFSAHGKSMKLVLQDGVDVEGRPLACLYLVHANGHPHPAMPIFYLFDEDITADDLCESPLIERLVNRIISDIENNFWSIEL
jgi:hypothetical protein